MNISYSYPRTLILVESKYLKIKEKKSSRPYNSGFCSIQPYNSWLKPRVTEIIQGECEEGDKKIQDRHGILTLGLGKKRTPEHVGKNGQKGGGR